jgi:polysaccharide export outer membrane protein
MNLRKLFTAAMAAFAAAVGLVGAADQGGTGGRSSGVISRMDTVQIRVFREDDLTTTSQLSADGSVTMPFIGPVRLEGLDTDQAAALITKKLKDGWLAQPQVSVSIEARIRRTVTVLGQTQSPGVFELPAHRELTLVEAIGMAGGATRIANVKKISLKRNGAVQTINLNDITNGKGKDVPLRDGDIVTIPESLF